MFGIIRPCHNRLGDELRTAWTAHLCGMCLALRDEHGHAARFVTNYDALVVSALVEAQTGADGRRRKAGPCVLRGMRSASVADGASARLAASVSLLLASAKLRDHVFDGDLRGAVRTRAAEHVATRWATAGTSTGAALGLDTHSVLSAVADQRTVESTARDLLEVTAPTEVATAQAFGHTAVLAGRPGNVEALTEAGRLFGRIAHLLDAVEDRADDLLADAWNPIEAFELSPDDVRGRCADAALGIRLALRNTTLVDSRLVHVLLTHEVDAAIARVFATAGAPGPHPPGQYPSPGQRPDGPGRPPPGSGPWPQAEGPGADAGRGPGAACLGWLVACGTCQVCCASEWENPCNGKRHEGVCRDCDCDCCDLCDCCDCCDC